MNARETLLGGAEYIRKHGWMAGFGCDGGPRCILGAMNSARGNPDEESIASMPGYGILEYLVYPGTSYRLGVGDFNDKCIENADEAIALLETAADLAI